MKTILKLIKYIFIFFLVISVLFAIGFFFLAKSFFDKAPEMIEKVDNISQQINSPEGRENLLNTALENETVKNVITNINEGVKNAVRIDNEEYSYLNDGVFFTIYPESTILNSNTQLEIKPTNSSNNGRLKTIQKTKGGRYFVRLTDFEPGTYSLMLQNVPNATGYISRTLTVPEKTPRIVLSFPMNYKIESVVGQNFTVPILLKNESFHGADYLHLQIYAGGFKPISVNAPHQIVSFDGKNAIIRVNNIEGNKVTRVKPTYKAESFASKLFISASIPNDYYHFIYREKSIGEISMYGEISGKPAVTSSTVKNKDDVPLILTEKRSAYCRENSASNIKACMKAQAQKDFACLREATVSAQMDCINNIY
jgi:hypothetical protein